MAHATPSPRHRQVGPLTRRLAEAPGLPFADLLPDEQNVRVFAASAFGEARAVDGGDCPARPGQLPAYGLEAPFVWAATRRDELDLEAHRATLAACPRWRRWLNPAPPTPPSAGPGRRPGSPASCPATIPAMPKRVAAPSGAP